MERDTFRGPRVIRGKLDSEAGWSGVQGGVCVLEERVVIHCGPRG